jgi:hypothetical protein
MTRYSRRTASSWASWAPGGVARNTGCSAEEPGRGGSPLTVTTRTGAFTSLSSGRSTAGGGANVCREALPATGQIGVLRCACGGGRRAVCRGPMATSGARNATSKSHPGQELLGKRSQCTDGGQSAACSAFLCAFGSTHVGPLRAEECDLSRPLSSEAVLPLFPNDTWCTPRQNFLYLCGEFNRSLACWFPQ